jgi:beta-barrel assembly-enhancing protease
MRKLSYLALVALIGGCAVSTQQEVEMGAGYAQQINKELPLIQDAELNRYINVLGDSIARIADTRGLDWQFFIVDSKDVNAFAVPGGFIYINRGLIERATTMAQVAGVLGHEVGHVTQRHSVQQMQKAQGANVGVTAVCILTNICDSQASQAAINLGAAAAFASFSRQDEDEADAVAVDYVMRAGIDPAGIPEMFQILLNEREAKPGSLDTWFRSHPLEESRITAARVRIGQLPPESVRGLTKDSPNFQAFKRRVTALPPPPPSRQP